MLVTRFVSLYKKADQFQLWQVLKQQSGQTVKVFLTKVASIVAIGGYQCSTALLAMATGLTHKAVATGAKCRQLQIAESQKEAIEGTRSTIMNLLDILVQEAYIYKEDVIVPLNVYDGIVKPTDPVGEKVGIRKCQKCGQVGHRNTVCTNAAACNYK